MFKLKYYDEIDSRRATRNDGQQEPPDFDIDDYASSSLWARTSSWLFNKTMLVVFSILRAFWPNPQFGRLVLVTREEDVRQVLRDSEFFEVPFGREMTDLAGGTNSVLGLDDAPHEEIRAILKDVLKESDLSRIKTKTASVAIALLSSSGGRIDVMKDLITRSASEACGEYLGLDIDDFDSFAGYTMAVSLLLFADPFGSDKTYRLAQRGAAQVRQIIDRSILRERRAGSRTDTVIGRLVALQESKPAIVTDGMIRGNIMGLATGLIPTVTLAAGKIFQEILKRPAVMKAAGVCARTDDDAGLRKILLEAGRLNPALSPGQWRYARRRATIAAGKLRAKDVREGSVLMVAVASALRDGRKFTDPTRFDVDRAQSPDLMFGFGPHECLGEHVAVAQMVEMFKALFAQNGLRRAEGPFGKLSSAGPFPRRLDVEFQPASAPASQSMITISVPVRQTDRARVHSALTALGNPARDDVRDSLTALDIVHFASLNLLEVGTDEAPDSRLVFEVNVDGIHDAALARIAQGTSTWLEPVFDIALGGRRTSFADTLRTHSLDLQTLPWGATGLNFNGTPEFCVAEIAKQAKLADFARDALQQYGEDHFGLGSRAMNALQFVRGLVHQDPRLVANSENPIVPDRQRQRLCELLVLGKEFAGFMVRPSRRKLLISEWTERSGWEGLVDFLKSSSFHPLGKALSLLLLLAFSVFYVAFDDNHAAGRIALALLSGILATLILAAATIVAFLVLLRWNEIRDLSDDREAPLTQMKAIAAIENQAGFVQNHFTAVTDLKNGWFRRLTLAVALWGIKVLVTHWYRPGFVLNMGTIHYAKWFRIPGTGKLIFLSNYDGSWQSYLEDFVMKAHAGQSAAWSNGVGFPRTRFLIYGGAQDGDRFKRWVRRQQVCSLFWYSRFPSLTTDQIRDNALIHDGLMRAASETAARAWLDCFGSIPRPGYAIETDEVQSLVFRAMGDRPFSVCALVRLPSESKSRMEWLSSLLPQINIDWIAATGRHLTDASSTPLAFGDRSLSAAGIQDAVTAVGFSSAGLARLGIDGTDANFGMATFPAAFRVGMANRERVLGDFGSSAPSRWLWADAANGDGTPNNPVFADAVLMIYGKTAEVCESSLGEHLGLLGGQAALLHVVRTSPADKESLDVNHLGFRDGISQPVIRGTERFNKGALPRDIVEPGEFILGYSNNQKYFPPTPIVATSTDIRKCLPNAPAQNPRFPVFSAGEASIRDFGRNGTFLVIRQLALDVNGFSAFVQEKADELGRYPELRAQNGGVSAKWVAAKLMGRWQDGTPMISGADSSTDNDFSYGIDDPQGLHCPFGAHIRRANPRDSLHPLDPSEQEITNRHRILRRGRSYEDSSGDSAEKGLLFACVCADIERQFEFVQQSWLGSPVFHGLNNEPDPIVVAGSPDETRWFTIPTPSGPVILKDMKSFVTVRAGGYFFMPSRSAIQYLIALQ